MRLFGITRGIVRGAFVRSWPILLDPFMAECLAIREGLKGVCDRGLQVHCVESDSLVAIYKYSSNSILDSIISYIRCLLIELGGGSCDYIPRQGNVVAHSLARESITLSTNMFWSHDYSRCISSATVRILLISNKG